MSEFTPTTSILPPVQPKTEEKPKENTLVSIATEVKSDTPEQGIELSVKKEEKTDDRLIYNAEDILNLMLQANKQERIDLKNDWNKLENLFYTQDKSYEAKAMYSSVVRLVAKNIVVISNKFSMEVNKINTKSVQPKLREICKEAFDKDYNVLPILEEEYLEAVQKFKKGERPAIRETSIDFGEKKEINASTKFMDELLG